MIKHALQHDTIRSANTNFSSRFCNASTEAAMLRQTPRQECCSIAPQLSRSPPAAPIAHRHSRYVEVPITTSRQPVQPIHGRLPRRCTSTNTSLACKAGRHQLHSEQLAAGSTSGPTLALNSARCAGVDACIASTHNRPPSFCRAWACRALERVLARGQFRREWGTVSGLSSPQVMRNIRTASR